MRLRRAWSSADGLRNRRGDRGSIRGGLKGLPIWPDGGCWRTIPDLRNGRRASRTSMLRCGPGTSRTPRRRWGYLGSAGRTSINTVGKASHLGVTALAGVAAGRVGKCDYHVYCLQERATEDASALVTAEGVAAEGSKFGLRAEGADQVSGSAVRVVHDASLLIALTTP